MDTIECNRFNKQKAVKALRKRRRSFRNRIGACCSKKNRKRLQINYNLIDGQGSVRKG